MVTKKNLGSVWLLGRACSGSVDGVWAMSCCWQERQCGNVRGSTMYMRQYKATFRGLAQGMECVSVLADVEYKYSIVAGGRE